MVQPAYMSWFREKDYQAFKSMPSGTDLPATFAEWEQLALDQVSQHKARGKSVEKVVIDPREFLAYCKACGLNDSNEVRGAFAVVTWRRQNENWYKP